MNTIQLVGQAITSTNYATSQHFCFTPEKVRQAAENFLAAGIDEIEVPQGVLDPTGKFPETGLDKETVKETVKGLPKGAKVLGTYLSGHTICKDNDGFVKTCSRAMEHLFEYFPHLCYAMVHPASPAYANEKDIKGAVGAWAKLAEFAAKKRPGTEICFHNHFDTCGETAEQVVWHLEEMAKIGNPALRWGPDTGHCHGMGGRYLEVFEKYAHLIGGHFHIKSRVSAFDSVHKANYQPERDIWKNPAEQGRGLYGGFVNSADPEIETPLKEVFALIKQKARGRDGVVRGAIEIDVPRQHPRLECLCSALYFKTVHGVTGGVKLSCDEIAKNVFAK